MRRNQIIIVLVLLIVVVFIARTLKGLRQNTPTAQPFNSSFVLQLEPGKESTVLKDGSKIKLLGIKENRCPEDVTCVWAGYADVELEVTAPGKTAEQIILRLGTVSGEEITDELGWNGMTLKLVSLEPLPNTKALIRLEQMKVTLRANKK